MSSRLFRFFLSASLFTNIGHAIAGNGAPSGAHYNLNIIGVANPKTADMSGNQGHRIFMPLTGKSRIQLAEGPSFAVLDANGTDGSAKFQMPSPDPDNDGVTVYSVYARALGKPGGSAVMTTCGIDPVTLEEICSLNSLSVERTSGRQQFRNVSAELLYVDADLDGDGIADKRISVFDPSLQDYFWSYDNKGLKVLQLRFYQISTNVNN